MKVARPRVITEALPGMENIGFSRAGKRADGGETAEPSNIVRDHGGSLGLLKHDLGDQDGVGVTGAAPWEGASVAAIPGEKGSVEKGGAFG
jgi:hypothetical protein